MAIFHHIEQGSAEWFALHCGIPTASQFHRIVTPTGKVSTSARSYAHYLVAEALLGRSLETESALEWIARGREMEPEAVRMYELHKDADCAPGGFVTTDDGRIGASPDRLLAGGRAGLEVKCPSPQVHIGYLLGELDERYKVQRQGQLWVGEFEYVDFWSYHPEMPPALVRTYRDEAFIGKLAEALPEFCDHLDALRERSRTLGLFGVPRRVLTPADQMIPRRGPEAFGLEPIPGFDAP